MGTQNRFIGHQVMYYHKFHGELNQTLNIFSVMEKVGLTAIVNMHLVG